MDSHLNRDHSLESFFCSFFFNSTQFVNLEDISILDVALSGGSSLFNPNIVSTFLNILVR